MGREVRHDVVGWGGPPAARVNEAGASRLPLPGHCARAAVRSATSAFAASAVETGTMRVDRVLAIAPFAGGAFLVLACGAEPATPVELCSAVLASKLPGSEVIAIVPQPPDRLELAYTLRTEDDAPLEGRLACEIERSRLGGPRLRGASLDGRPLSDTELVVRNANLLLDELYAIGGRSG